MMKLHIDRDSGRVVGYTTSGQPTDPTCDYVEVKMREQDICDDLFYSIYENGKLRVDETWKQKAKEEQRLDVIRARREAECFAIVNRGAVWYTFAVNTDKRRQQLQAWYEAWLDAPQTGIIPVCPDWIS